MCFSDQVSAPVISASFKFWHHQQNVLFCLHTSAALKSLKFLTVAASFTASSSMLRPGLVVQIAFDLVEFNLVCYHRHCQLVHFIFELSPHQKQLVMEEGAIWTIRSTTNGWVQIDRLAICLQRASAGTVCSTERSNLLTVLWVLD